MMAFQSLLLFIYIDVMFTLVNEVLGEPISGVVILIYAVPITGLYVMIAGVAFLLGMSLEYASGVPEEGVTSIRVQPVFIIGLIIESKDIELYE